MIDLSGSARYAAPAATIFAIITDPPCYPAWQPDVESVSPDSHDPARLGSHIRQIRTVMGRRTEVALTVTQLVPGELVTLATAPGARPAVQQTYWLHTDGDGCRLEFTLTLDGVPTLAEHLARAQLTRQIQQMFERLATIAASRRSA